MDLLAACLGAQHGGAPDHARSGLAGMYDRIAVYMPADVEPRRRRLFARRATPTAKLVAAPGDATRLDVRRDPRRLPSCGAPITAAPLQRALRAQRGVLVPPLRSPHRGASLRAGTRCDRFPGPLPRLWAAQAYPPAAKKIRRARVIAHAVTGSA